MNRLTYKQSKAKSCGAAAAAVAEAELSGSSSVTGTQEDAIYKAISRDYGKGEVSAPASIARYFKDKGFRASIVESPIRTTILLAAQFKKFAPEWWKYTTERWEWKNWITVWPRGLRERDFDNDARVLMVCATPNGLHYLLVRRDGKDYYVMDPADASDRKKTDFPSWAGLYWIDKKSWDPSTPLSTCRDNYYLGIGIWVNSLSALYVWL